MTFLASLAGLAILDLVSLNDYERALCWQKYFEAGRLTSYRSGLYCEGKL